MGRAMSRAALALGAIAGLAGCSYDAKFADCEVRCQVGQEDACPDGFSCVEGLCRVDGAGGTCLAPGEVTLRQTADDKVERSLVFGCTNPDQSTAAGSWYRVFSLADDGLGDGLDVTSVGLGICFAVGEPTVQVRIGSYGGDPGAATLDLAQITPISSVDVPIAATQISKTLEVPLPAEVPPGNLIVEVEVPDLEGTAQEVNVGFTAGSERTPGYVRSPLCGPAAPTTTTEAGLPNAHLVISVTGKPR